eukprot:11648298-Alexandrium_andersonii.AAC.1
MKFERTQGMLDLLGVGIHPGTSTSCRPSDAPSSPACFFSSSLMKLNNPSRLLVCFLGAIFEAQGMAKQPQQLLQKWLQQQQS